MVLFPLPVWPTCMWEKKICWDFVLLSLKMKLSMTYSQTHQYRQHSITKPTDHNQHLMLLTPTHSSCYQRGSAAMRLLALPVSYRGKLKIRNKEENGDEYSTLSPHINQYGGCSDDILRGVQEVHGGHWLSLHTINVARSWKKDCGVHSATDGVII